MNETNKNTMARKAKSSCKNERKCKKEHKREMAQAVLRDLYKIVEMFEQIASQQIPPNPVFHAHIDKTTDDNIFTKIGDINYMLQTEFHESICTLIFAHINEMVCETKEVFKFVDTYKNIRGQNIWIYETNVDTLHFYIIKILSLIILFKLT